MATAKFIRQLSNFRGDARLFECDPPAKDYKDNGHKFVVVSAADVPFSGPETYMFPANEDGEVIDWGEMPSSRRGVVSHEQVLHDAGYEVIT